MRHGFIRVVVAMGERRREGEVCGGRVGVGCEGFCSWEGRF